jgi:hypothetical protein
MYLCGMYAFILCLRTRTQACTHVHVYIFSWIHILSNIHRQIHSNCARAHAYTCTCNACYSYKRQANRRMCTHTIVHTYSCTYIHACMHTLVHTLLNTSVQATATKRQPDTRMYTPYIRLYAYIHAGCSYKKAT